MNRRKEETGFEGPKRKWDEEVKDSQRERGVTIRNAVPRIAVRTRWERLAPSTPLSRRVGDKVGA